MSYRLSRKAQDDIIAIYLEGARLFGISQAESYHTGLERCLDLIAAAPEMARERLEILPPVRIHPFRMHIIIYVIGDDGTPFILRVRHAREDWHRAPA